MNRIRLTLAAALLTLSALPALAQTTASAGTTTQTAQATQTSPLQLVLNDYLVTSVRGVGGRVTERLNPDATRARPGDVIQYEVSAKNTSQRTLQHARPVLAVPAGTVFVASAGGSQNVTTEYSFDGGKTFGAAPLFKTVVVNGTSQRVQVQPSEYTNVRWTVARLAPGEAYKMVLRVRVR
ncbi:hypothetical protein [Deinococcus radiophilus]|uniref:DUF11 domain-containing protein n=1 Tax=Deinococcus radiophilus TaxID=32062 RepID=A0A431VXH5_9DEIO|nr:hypothetical protein [Deinococcus radiophilus]RTR27766.1 hypothetical protein EJ104_06165 [Deinococcus radiophilus]UFA50085.1 hypothetical protein LMT64_09385 [Deinococcus radiophilus]